MVKVMRKRNSLRKRIMTFIMAGTLVCTACFGGAGSTVLAAPEIAYTRGTPSDASSNNGGNQKPPHSTGNSTQTNGSSGTGAGQSTGPDTSGTTGGAAESVTTTEAATTEATVAAGTEAQPVTTTQAATEAPSGNTSQSGTGTQSGAAGNTAGNDGQEEEVTEEADPYADYELQEFGAESENRVEQIKGNLPTVWTVFYYNGRNGELQSGVSDNVSMIFNGNEWQAAELLQWDKTEYGINYYVLLDTSGSVAGFFDELKDAITGLAMDMEDSDTLTVYAVGEEGEEITSVIDRATSQDIDEIEESLEGLSPDAQYTYLNDAITDLVEVINANNKNTDTEGFSGRDIILVLSDGDNESYTGKTSEEVKEVLRASNIPLYAFMSKNSSSSNGNPMEGIAASGGGDCIYVEGHDYSDAVKNQVNIFQDAWIATFTNTDAVTETEYTVELRLILNNSMEIWEYAEKQVTFYKAVPDTEAPYVTGVILSGANTIDITFSEFVSGAAAVSAYRIAMLTADGETGEVAEDETALQAVSVTEVGNHTDYTYRITLSDTIYRGDYRISFSQITDLQGNPLSDTSCDVTFDEAPEKPAQERGFFARFWWIFLAAFLIILAVILFIAYRIIKKNKGLVVVDGKAVLAKNTDVKQHIVLEQQSRGQAIEFYLYSGGKVVKKLDARVEGSIIIGRSDLCDIFIDDVMMSRQHFAIEYDGESFYIQDLDTTNGTMLNGVKLTHKRRLEKDDKITAGSLDIVVRW